MGKRKTGNNSSRAGGSAASATGVPSSGTERPSSRLSTKGHGIVTATIPLPEIKRYCVEKGLADEIQLRANNRQYFEALLKMGSSRPEFWDAIWIILGLAQLPSNFRSEDSVLFLSKEEVNRLKV